MTSSHLARIDPPDGMVSEWDTLTDRQRWFVLAYCGEARGNAAGAARIAGYAGSAQTLATTGYENLSNPYIVACIRSRARAILSEYDTAERLASFIRSEPAALERNAWVKAIELWFKYHGALDERVQVEHTTRRQIEVHDITYTTIDSTAREADATSDEHRNKEATEY